MNTNTTCMHNGQLVRVIPVIDSEPKLIETDHIGKTNYKVDYYQDAMNWIWRVRDPSDKHLVRGTSPDQQTAKDEAQRQLIALFEAVLVELRAVQNKAG